MSVYDQLIGDDGDFAAAAVTGAVGPSPAKAAKAVDLGGKSGVPPSVVFLDPEGWQDQLRQEKAAGLVRGSPYLQRYIGSDPMAAPTSYDDLGALDAFANASATFAAMHKDQAIPKWTPPPAVAPADAAQAQKDFEKLKVGDEIPSGNPMVAEPPPALVVPNSADEVVKRAKELSDQRGKVGLPVETAVQAFDPAGFAEGMTQFQEFLSSNGVGGPVGTLATGAAGALDLTTRLTSAGLGFLSGAAENIAPGLGRDVNMLGQTVLTLLGAEYFHPAEPRVVANSKAIETLGKLADESTTKAQAAPLFNDFAHQMLGDQTIEIPFEALRKVYESHGEVPHGGDGILGFVPDIADQVARAAHTNGDVTVNLADFLTHADPKVREEFLPDVRARPEDSTPNELVKAKDELEEQIKEDDQLVKGIKEAVKKETQISVDVRALTNPEVIAASKHVIRAIKVRGRLFEKTSSDIEKPAYSAAHADLFPEIINTFMGELPKHLDRLERADERKKIEADLESALEAGDFGYTVGGKFVGNLNDAVAAGHQMELDKAGMAPSTVERAIPETPAARVRKELFLDPLFTEPKAAGMTAEEFAIHSRNAERAAADIEEARSNVYDKIVKIQKEIDDLNRQKTAEVNLAEDAIAEGRLDDAAGHQAAAATYDRPIEKLTERLPDAIGAEDIVFSDPITRVLHDDLRVMRRQTEGEAAPPIHKGEMEQWGREQVASMTVKDAAALPAKLLNDIKKTGREAFMAALKGKKPAAFKARNEQFMNQVLGKAAKEFEKERIRANKMIKRFSKREKIASVDQAYTDQIQRLLAAHGVPLARKDTFDHLPPLHEFVSFETGWGNMIEVADWLYDETRPQRPEDMTVEQFREFAKSIESLEHNGRQALKVIAAGKEADKKMVIDAAVANIRTVEPLQFPQGGAHLRRFWQIDASLTRMEKFIDIWDRRNPNGPLNDTVMRPLQGSKHYRQELFNRTADYMKTLPPIKNGRQKLTGVPFENAMLRDDGVMVRRPYQFTRADVVNIAFNMGNKRNRQLVVYTMKGAEIADKLQHLPEGDRPIIEAFLKDQAEKQILDWVDSTLTKDDWTFVEGLWSFFNELKPEIDAMYRRLAGVAPDTVEPMAINSAHGRFDGGYAPITYDPFMSDISAKKQDLIFEDSFTPIATPNSYVKKRTNVYKKLKLEGGIDLLSQTIRTQLHDLAFHESIQNAWKILRDPRLRQAITDHYGKEYTDILGPWLQGIANQFNVADRQTVWVSNMMRDIRAGMATAVLGLNPKVILSPNIAPVLAKFAVDPLFAQRYMDNIEAPRAFVYEHSAEIRNRMMATQRDISAQLGESLGLETNFDKFKIAGARFGMALTVKIDTLIGEVVWLSEYAKQIESMNHEDAVYAADKAVRDGLGSHATVDLPTLMNSGEMMKNFTLFYGFGSTMFNKQRDILRMAKEGVRRVKAGDNAGAKRDFGNVLAGSMAFVFVTALFNALYQPALLKFDEDTENLDFGKSVANLLASQLASTLPFAREFANGLLTGRAPGGAPIFSVGQRLLSGAKDMAKAFPGGEEPTQFIRNAGYIAGFLLHIPTGAPGTSAQFVWNLTTGQDEAHTAADWFNGLVYGKSGN